VAAEGPAVLIRLVLVCARSNNRRLVNSSAFSARLRRRSAYAFKKFASIDTPLNAKLNFAAGVSPFHVAIVSMVFLRSSALVRTF
jgi:hypothetical protein